MDKTTSADLEINESISTNFPGKLRKITKMPFNRRIAKISK